jgi:serine/threonine protein kinase
MVTCIDISTLYREKRGKAISVANYLCSLKHKNFIHIYRYFIHEERLIFIEMEVPLCLTTWKTFCKKKFSPEEIFSVFQQVSEGIEHLHKMNFIHRDIHPSRIQCFNGNIIKFNLIGLPYNFKKLVKRDNFSGHINYSAPELILEK